ncbi:MAG TPA: hypothetical protein VEX39_11675 [Thermoleophilaceae bacterium]|nr:hypothetical protein [Thermoleophilaceae bacterium]
MFLTIIALAVVVTTPARAATSAPSEQVTQGTTETVATAARARRCRESFVYVSKLRAWGIGCRLAGTAMKKWLRNNACGLDDTCAIRIGRNGNLWNCSSYRSYASLNPYYSSCYSAGNYNLSATWTYRHKASR